ncbi:MAG: hypothetical protein RI947_1394 [Candidatus Parcubacteria bacterium]|jgi:hypothetical protein
MKDYSTLWEDWATAVESTGEEKQKLIESVHDEVKAGIDAIVKAAAEELSKRLEGGYMKDEEQVTKEVLAVTVWSGYLLYLTDNNIDAVKLKLNEVKATEELGSTWMEQYDKDQNKSLLMEIDPVISMFLEKLKQSKISYLLSKFPELMSKSYKRVSDSETFINWAAHQGYILGMLESKLSHQ